jgi:Domain of unknown function (DUF4034)
MGASVSRALVLLGIAGLLTSCRLAKPLNLDSPSFNLFSQTVEKTISSHKAKRVSKPENKSIDSKAEEVPKKLLTRYKILPSMEDWCDELYKKENFTKIEEYINNLLKEEKDELASARLQHLYGVLGNLKNRDYHFTPEDKRQFEQQILVLNKWVKVHPKSHIPWTVRGILLTKYGWEIRSDKYAKDVLKEAWPPFKENLEKARIDLENAASINGNDPNTWSSLMTIAMGLGLAEDLETYYEKGVAANPYNTGVRAAKVVDLFPQWDGSSEETLAFAKYWDNEAKRLDKPLLSGIMLMAIDEMARVEKENGGSSRDYLKQPKIWATIQDIYNRLITKYPDQIANRFNYAYYAYSAGHVEEALKQYEIIEDRWIDGTEWESLEKFHRFRSRAYLDVAYEAQAKGDYNRAETLALKSAELLPSGRAYLFLGSLYGNVNRDMKKTLEYSRRSLNYKLTEVERHGAEANIRLSEEILKASPH